MIIKKEKKRIRLKNILSPILILIILNNVLVAQNPEEKWFKYKNPEEDGWSLDEIMSAFEESNAAALMVVVDGKVVTALGDIKRKYKTHSVRKSFLNALYGVYVDKGIIDTNKTLTELGITDVNPLYTNEKKARIVDLLKARSGVYIPAGAETQYMKENRPKRLSHKPNTFWYYNNWDFNVLGTIFRKETQKEIPEEFYNQIAKPLQMEDFELIDGSYDYTDSKYSIHPSYPFKMSVRDMAKFGQLYLQDGRWNSEQIISSKWVKDSFTSYSFVTNEGPGYDGYGYLWWTGKYADSIRANFASGVGGCYIGVFYPKNMVIVICGDTYEANFINNRYDLIKKILAAKKDIYNSNSQTVSMDNQKPSGEFKTIVLDSTERQKFIGEYKGEYINLYGNNNDSKKDRKFYIMERQEDLVLLNYDYCYQYKLLPLANNRFFVKDIQLFLTFALDDSGEPLNPVFHKSLITETLYNTIIQKSISEGYKHFNDLSKEIKSEFELKFLADNLRKINKNEEALDVFRWNILQFPMSVDANRAYISEFIKQKDRKYLPWIYDDLYKTISKTNKDTKIILWFSQWLKALVHPLSTDKEEFKQFIGDYGPRHIIWEDGSLYYYRDDRSTIKKYRLIKAFDDGINPVFILEGNSLDYFRIKFVIEDGKVIKLIGQTIDGGFSESIKD
jgi:CubicO group peptidase (beta-lactamase class C family)